MPRAAGTPDEDVEADLIRRLHKLLPWMPEHAHASLKVWRVSQVRHPIPLPGAGTHACLDLSSAPATTDGPIPPLVLAGDAFSPLGSRFDGCVQSGEQAASAVLKALEL